LPFSGRNSNMEDYSDKGLLTNKKKTNNFHNLKSALWRDACFFCF